MDQSSRTRILSQQQLKTMPQRRLDIRACRHGPFIPVIQHGSRWPELPGPPTDGCLVESALFRIQRMDKDMPGEGPNRPIRDAAFPTHLSSGSSTDFSTACRQSLVTVATDTVGPQASPPSPETSYGLLGGVQMVFQIPLRPRSPL